MAYEKHWMQKAVKKPNALRKTLGIKKGKKIPDAKLEKATHSKNKKTAARARLAETFKKFRK